MARLTVLFLCTGNTCRSPLAEALARHRFGEEGTRFLSAGLQAWPGQPASIGSLQSAADRDATLEEHRSRVLTPELVAKLDWVIVMTRSHAAIFRQRFPDFGGSVALLGTPGLDMKVSALPDSVEEVNDPWGGEGDRYDFMAAQVERLLEDWRDIFAAGP